MSWMDQFDPNRVPPHRHDGQLFGYYVLTLVTNFWLAVGMHRLGII